MSIMTERDRAAVRTEFEKLTGPVKLVVFSQELLAGDLCRQNEALVREVAELSDQISVEVLNPGLAPRRTPRRARGRSPWRAPVTMGYDSTGSRPATSSAT